MIKAKIDSHKKLLISRTVNTQLETYQKVCQTGAKFINDTEVSLMKMACAKKDVVLKKPMGSLTV